MKKVLIHLVALSQLCFAQAQLQEARVPASFHKHEGFYLSLNGGPSFGNIKLGSAEFSGPGFLVDFKIGSVVSEDDDLILSFDILARTIVSPIVSYNGKSAPTSSDVSAGDIIYGAGISKYFMPLNIFVNGSIGIGKFNVQANGLSGDSQNGFGFQVKAGKEWWVSNDWALGIAGGMACVYANDPAGKLSTSRFFLIFNSTLN